LQHGVVMTVVGLALAGCGETDPRESAAKTVNDFQGATVDEDGDAYCELLSTRAKEEALVAFAGIGGGFDCPKAAEKAFNVVGKDELNRIEEAQGATGPEDVTVRGDRARVNLPSGNQIRLIRSEDEWLVDTLPRKPRKARRARR
jgi:hypothetical protein